MRAVLYARVSTTTEDQATSPANQLERCRQLCALRGWDVVAEHTDTMSGTRLDRAGFTAAVAMLRNKQAEVLVAATLDRIARTTDFMPLLRTEIQARGANIATVDGGFDTTTASGRMILSILLSTYQYQVEQSAEKLRATNGLKRQRGRLVSGRPFGTKRGENGVGRVRDPQTYPLLQEIFERAAAGEPVLRIARDFQARGVPTVDGGGWWQQTVRSIVQCRWYIGEIVHAGEVVAQAEPHDCMIPRELWDAAQPRGQRGRPSDYIYLLRGLVVSSHWRYTAPESRIGQPVRFTAGKDRNGKPVYIREDQKQAPYYKPHDADADAERMPKTLKAAELEGIVVSRLIEVTAGDELLTVAQVSARDYQAKARAEVQQRRKDQAAAEAQYQRIQARLLRALDTQSDEAIKALNAATGAARREAEASTAALVEAERRAEERIVKLPDVLRRVSLIGESWRKGNRQELANLIPTILEQVDVRANKIHFTTKPVLEVGEIQIPVGRGSSSR